MYPNTYFARATVSTVAVALIALGHLGYAWSATEFMPASGDVASSHSCDIVVVANALCQGGQHRHGTSPTVGRDYQRLSPRPMA